MYHKIEILLNNLVQEVKNDNFNITYYTSEIVQLARNYYNTLNHTYCSPIKEKNIGKFSLDMARSKIISNLNAKLSNINSSCCNSKEKPNSNINLNFIFNNTSSQNFPNDKVFNKQITLNKKDYQVLQKSNKEHKKSNLSLNSEALDNILKNLHNSKLINSSKYQGISTKNLSKVSTERVQTEEFSSSKPEKFVTNFSKYEKLSKTDLKGKTTLSFIPSTTLIKEKSNDKNFNKTEIKFQNLIKKTKQAKKNYSNNFNLNNVSVEVKNDKKNNSNFFSCSNKVINESNKQNYKGKSSNLNKQIEINAIINKKY